MKQEYMRTPRQRFAGRAFARLRRKSSALKIRTDSQPGLAKSSVEGCSALSNGCVAVLLAL
jgi:hypothetical protein